MELRNKERYNDPTASKAIKRVKHKKRVISHLHIG